MKDIYGDFYNPTKLLSTHKPYLFSIGVRSAGKSTGFCIHLLKEYMKSGKQFIYMRRTKDELEANAHKAFNNAIWIYNDYYKGKKGYPKIESFEFKNNVYYINEKIAGFAIPLSLQSKYKSIDFSNVWYVLYDEFLISESGGTYLGGRENMFKECEAIMSLFITVDRRIGEAFRNELTMICIGNNETYQSPVFMRMGIDKFLTKETRFLNPKNEGWAVEQTFSVKALSEAKKSNAYLLSSDYTKSYAFEGGIFDEKFIGCPDGRLYPLFNIAYSGYTYGVYNTENYDIYISTKECRDCPTLAATGKDHSPDYELIKQWHSNFYMTKLRDSIVKGKIWYENARCKYAIETFYGYDK